MVFQFSSEYNVLSAPNLIYDYFNYFKWTPVSGPGLFQKALAGGKYQPAPVQNPIETKVLLNIPNFQIFHTLETSGIWYLESGLFFAIKPQMGPFCVDCWDAKTLSTLTDIDLYLFQVSSKSVM